MTCIAWDGEVLAADRLGCANGVCSTDVKAWRIGDAVVAITGNISAGLGVVEWFKRGEKVEDWPSFQTSDEWSELIVVRGREVYSYEHLPYKVMVNDKFYAWGSGRAFAIGAMAAGKNAIEAVKIASKFQNNVGRGVLSFRINK